MLSDFVDTKDPEVAKLLETSLVVSANFHDDASPGKMEQWSSAQRRAADLRQARVMLAIVSLASTSDVECERERCEALMMNKTVIPVFLDGCTAPIALLHVSGFHLAASERLELAQETYVRLLRSLQSGTRGPEPQGA